MKIIRRTMISVILLIFIALLGGYIAKPWVESRLTTPLISVQLSPRLDGRLGITLVQEGRLFVTAEADWVESLKGHLQIRSAMIDPTAWQNPTAEALTPAQLIQIMQRPLAIAALPYRRISFEGVQIKNEVLDKAILQGELTKNTVGAWEGHFSLLSKTSVAPSLEGTLHISALGGYQLAVKGTWRAQQINVFDLSVEGGKAQADPIVQGTVELVAWPKLDVSFSLAKGLHLSGDMTTPLFSLQGLLGDVGVAQLWPLKINQQNLSARLLEVGGVPLFAPRVTVSSEGVKTLSIEKASAQVFQGRVSLSSSINLSLPRPSKIVADLKFEHIDLAEALQLAGVEGLSGDGRLSGQVPFTFEEGKLRFGAAQLEALAAGHIAYMPQTPPAFMAEGGQGQLIAQIFNNFLYDTLTLKIGGAIGEDMTLGVRLVGKNPSFYNGHPVALTLNLSGALMAVLQNGLKNFHFTDDQLRDMIQMDKDGGSRP